MESHQPKRRQYATDQTRAYDAAPPDIYDNRQPNFQPPSQSQFIDPASQQAAFDPNQPQPASYYQHPVQSPLNPAAGQYPQHNVHATSPRMVDQLASGISQMNFGQKQFSFQTINLLGQLPDPIDLFRPPPEIRLPPNSSVIESPYANADPSYKRSTLNAIPTTSSLLTKSHVPFGLVITPYRTVKEGDNPVPVISDHVIARCKRCRSYINPYVQFLSDGSRWKCCMCGIENETPELFDWDSERNVRADRWSRAELNHSVVEYVAPREYMARLPQSPVYVFLIDVSHEAVQSGMTAIAAVTILESLDRLPNENNLTMISIIAFDDSLYFFSLAPGCLDPPMTVVSDLDDVFLPFPNNILVNLTKARDSIENLLKNFNKMFSESPRLGGAVGPALEAGFKLIQPVGGKVLLLSSSLPTLGAGALKKREDPKSFGTSKESSLLQPASAFYKTFAISCARAHVSVDMFLFSSAYTDIATLSCLPRYTSGQTYFYPAFNAARSEDARKFAHEFSTILASPIAFETIMRIRATRGIRLSMFHGNFFISSSDLLTLPNLPVDQSYVIEAQIEETINSPFVLFQTALVITTCFGERRIRVINLALPTTSTLSEMYASVDEIALTSYLASKTVEKTLSHKLEDARDSITNQLTKILIAYKGSMTSSGAGASSQLAICDNMKMFPLMCLGLLKNVAIRQSSQIPSDLRAYGQALLTTLPPQQLVPYIHPNFYSLHDMPDEAGTIGEYGVILPAPLPLTFERMTSYGLYLIEDGQNIFLWIGREAVPKLMEDVFNIPSSAQLHGGKATLPVLDNPFSKRINAIIGKIREMRRGPYWQHLYIVKEDGEPALRHWALSTLIMDRIDQLPSYQQYLSGLREKVNGTS